MKEEAVVVVLVSLAVFVLLLWLSRPKGNGKWPDGCG